MKKLLQETLPFLAMLVCPCLWALCGQSLCSPMPAALTSDSFLPAAGLWSFAIFCALINFPSSMALLKLLALDQLTRIIPRRLSKTGWLIINLLGLAVVGATPLLLTHALQVFVITGALGLMGSVTAYYYWARETNLAQELQSHASAS